MKVLSVGMTVCDVLISPVPDNVMELDSITIRKPVMACGSVADGVRQMLADTPPDGASVCCGSLYLLGDVAQALEKL